MCELQLVIDSVARNVDLVGVSVKALALSSEFFDRSLSDNIELCVVEAVTNCIEHSYRGEIGHKIKITWRQEPDRIIIDVEDYGACIPADILESKSPPFSYDLNDLDSLPEGHRGIDTIKSLMDTFSYKSLDGVNNFLMVKYKPASAAAPANV
jgi:serine/threonine-protein kinase RsbW